MVTILTMMALGIMVGYFVRRMQLKWLDNVQIGFVWLLLFLLGAEAGGNERVVRWIASLGLEAFAEKSWRGVWHSCQVDFELAGKPE
ncbi:MAG: hypothetical protein K2N76_04595, partial [Muribaculaceae bacterium]|nr:hypothetical protein [Muribaculaceae bacterium]